MVYLLVREIIHSLELVDYLHIQADKPFYTYYSSTSQKNVIDRPALSVGTCYAVSNSLVISLMIAAKLIYLTNKKETVRYSHSFLPFIVVTKSLLTRGHFEVTSDVKILVNQLLLVK